MTDANTVSADLATLGSDGWELNRVAANRMDIEGRIYTRSPADVAGDPGCCALLADDAAPGANDVLTSATGFQAFEAMLAGALGAIGTGVVALEMVAVAWSTLADDHDGVAALLALAVDEFDGTATAPPVLINNCRILRTIDDVVGAIWDGETTIKTIGVRMCGTTPGSATVGVLINTVA